MRIRSATRDDIPQLIAIAQESVSAGHWTVAQYEQALEVLQPRRVVLVLEDQDQIVGFVVSAELAGEWELENIAVRGSAKRSGHGERLLAAVLERLEHARASSIHLEVRRSNSAARALYEKWGFRQVGVRPGYYHSPAEDAILYQKNLASTAREMG